MKDEKQKLIFNIVGAFKRTMKLERELEKKPRDYGTGEKLYSSEIHMIEAIGVSESLSVTDVADYFGITKGAVSQTLKKLENKGLVKKEKDPENSSRLLLGLTSKGKAAFYSHMHWHEKMDGGFRDAFFSFEKEQLEFMLDFLKMFETFLKNRRKGEE
ncbi:MAG: MarR family transcriptional regulator [Desulfobacterales bacterium]|nr:MarR family transcriptional regulator [Desulfobacterales bacterium]